MRLQLQLILITYIVNFWLTSVQSDNQMVDEAVISKINDGPKIRQNFENLFKSIAKKNTEKSEIYHEILKQGVAMEQEAFDTMKGELQAARKKNAYKKRNFYQKSDVSENIRAVKRETKKIRKKNRKTEASVRPFDQTELEDMFVDRFGDNYTIFEDWQPIKGWYMEEGEPKLKKFCASAHKTAGKEEIDLNVLVLRPRFITFEKYQPKRVDMVAYGVADPSAKNPDMLYWHTPEGQHWYITEGLQPDCVFYTTIPNITIGTFQLIDYVCGIDVPK